MKSHYSKYLLLPVLVVGGYAMVKYADLQQQATPNAVVTAEGEQASPALSDDIVARVGDQAIHFSELNTMLNSSAVVGLSIPALGTPERDTVRITLLDKMVSANLIYLDALAKGIDKDPKYQRELQQFGNAVLGDLYYQKHLVGDVPVSEAEIQDYFTESIVPGTELSAELRSAIEAMVRKRKLDEQQTDLRMKLRDGIEIAVYQNNFTSTGDAKRDDSVPVADLGGEMITWGEVKDHLIAAGKGAIARDPLAMEIDARLAALQGEIDTRLLAQRAHAAGLESDPVYVNRLAEFGKTRLINLHRQRLAAQMEPTDQQLHDYYDANHDQISVPEFRKVQMVMLDTQAQAQSLKERIESGELTLYQAAADYSVAPDAKQNLGEIGWIGEGKTRPALNEVIFTLLPAEIGGPVEAGGLWHLVSVLDTRDAQYGSFDEAATRTYVRRRFIHEKLDNYVVDLRKNAFPVEVYEDVIIQQAQQEADLVKTLVAQSQEPLSVTQTRIKELQKQLKPQEH